MAMNTTINALMYSTCRPSLMVGAKLSRIRSKTNVEAETMTNDDNVDMDADSTKITTNAI